MSAALSVFFGILGGACVLGAICAVCAALDDSIFGSSRYVRPRLFLCMALVVLAAALIAAAVYVAEVSA